MRIHPTALIEPGTKLGTGCVEHPVIGADPQELAFDTNKWSGALVGVRSLHRATRIKTQGVPLFTRVPERDSMSGLNVSARRIGGISEVAFTELKQALHRVCAPIGNPRVVTADGLASGRYQTAEAHCFLAFFSGGRRPVLRLTV